MYRCTIESAPDSVDLVVFFALVQTYAPSAEKKVKTEHSLEDLAKQFEDLRTENQEMRETINLLKDESQELRAQNQLLMQNSQLAMSKAHDLQVRASPLLLVFSLCMPYTLLFAFPVRFRARMLGRLFAHFPRRGRRTSCGGHGFAVLCSAGAVLTLGSAAYCPLAGDSGWSGLFVYLITCGVGRLA